MMQMQIVLIWCVLLTFVSLLVVSSASKFRSKSSAGYAYDTPAIDVFSATLSQGQSTTSRRIENIKANTLPTFESLPKNEFGKLAPRAFHHLLREYFIKEHGWLISGLESHSNPGSADLLGVQILKDKAPELMEWLLDASKTSRGFSRAEAALVVSVLEQLLFKESHALLSDSYMLNGFFKEELLRADDVHEVLTSLLVLLKDGDERRQSKHGDAQTHRAEKQIISSGGTWDMTFQYAQEAFENFTTARAADVHEFSFDDVSQITDILVEGYGKWQQTDCTWMQQDLMSMDSDGSGRVPLSRFYGQQPHAHFVFSESVEYLRTIGALDESDASEPKVFIANYVGGPSNCVADTAYFSVCCFTGCQQLMAQLEAEVRAPTANPDYLLSLAGNLSSTFIKAPRVLPDKLQKKMHSIADHHGGMVPLHSRLFSQWLHHAFPLECPFPQINQESAVLMPSHWQGTSSMSSEQERKKYMELVKEKGEDYCEAEMLWHDDEVLHANEGAPSTLTLQQPRYIFGSAWLRMLMQLAMLGSLAVAAFRMLPRDARRDAKRKELPL
eukprot:TRINITY_DN666_c0_g1_i1.p1 TRINITY_DN666_c0_g1~~TRINITY_DN666_c0_g1_i1.p1  ORF type:complete len:556 (-),score=106.15 TRINITY_DN666_c0_g1_i1:81-1748(-)